MNACPECGTPPVPLACHDCGEVALVLECEHTRAADAAYVAAARAYNARPEETRLDGRPELEAALASARAARCGHDRLSRGRLDGSESGRLFCESCACNFAGNLLCPEEIAAINEVSLELRGDPEALRDALLDILPDDDELDERIAADEARERLQ